jgi:hypothetical protein
MSDRGLVAHHAVWTARGQRGPGGRPSIVFWALVCFIAMSRPLPASVSYLYVCTIQTYE